MNQQVIPVQVSSAPDHLLLFLDFIYSREETSIWRLHYSLIPPFFFPDPVHQV